MIPSSGTASSSSSSSSSLNQSLLIISFFNMVSFKHYCLFSILSVCCALSYSFTTRKQFYLASIYLSSNKINLIILSNFAFLLLLLMGKLLIKIFFNTLSRDESEELLTLCKYTITENCLA